MRAPLMATLAWAVVGCVDVPAFQTSPPDTSPDAPDAPDADVADGGAPVGDGGSDAACVASCAGRACGEDGCGGLCGRCQGALACNPDGRCVAAGALAGNTCAAPFPVDAIPFERTASTLYASDAFTLDAACAPGGTTLGAGAPDHVYRLVADVAGVYTVHVNAAFEVALYALADCATPGSCRAAAAGPGQAQLSLPLAADEARSLVVDGLDPDHPGDTYVLYVQRSCAPRCALRLCGDDGCGGSCGVCAAPLPVCDEALGRCTSPDAVVGNTCANPYIVDALPFAADGTTADKSNALAASATCPGISVERGAASPDAVYRLEVREEAAWDITLTSAFDAALYVLSGCAEGDDVRCIAASDTVGLAPERLTLDLPPGTYHVVVDGFSNDGPVAGSYSLSISDDL